MDPNIRDFKSLPIEEQMVLAQSFREGSIEDLERAERKYVSVVDADNLRRVESSLRNEDRNERLMALMRDWGR